MASKQQLLFKETIQKQTQSYLKDALQECSKCWETSMNDPCSANCDRDYLLFLSSKRVLKSKLATCLKSSSSKAQDACYTDAIKDLRSLDKFIIRTKSSELTTIQSAPSTQQK